MFYILSKTLFYVLMPFTWVFILIILTYFSKSLKVKKGDSVLEGDILIEIGD